MVPFFTYSLVAFGVPTPTIDTLSVRPNSSVACASPKISTEAAPVNPASSGFAFNNSLAFSYAVSTFSDDSADGTVSLN